MELSQRVWRVRPFPLKASRRVEGNFLGFDFWRGQGHLGVLLVLLGVSTDLIV